MAYNSLMDLFFISLCFQLHLLHWNPKYSNYLDAVRRTDGIAVLAIFLQVGALVPPLYCYCSGFYSCRVKKNKTFWIYFLEFISLWRAWLSVVHAFQVTKYESCYFKRYLVHCPSSYSVTMWLVEAVNPDVFSPALGTQCQ